MTMSVSTTCVIAIHRYHTIVNNLRFTMWTNTWTLGITWLISISVGIPMLFVQKIQPIKDAFYGIDLYEVCTEDWGVGWGKEAFTGFILVTHYVVPFVIIAKVHHSILKFINMERIYQKSPLMKQRESSRNRQTTRLLLRVSTAFFFCWLPYHIFYLLYDHSNVFDGKTELLYITYAVVHFTAMSSTFWNACLYGFLNSNIQAMIISAFRSTFRCGRRPKAPTVILDCSKDTFTTFTVGRPTNSTMSRDFVVTNL